MATVDLPEVVVTPLKPKGQSNSNIPIPKVNRLGARVGGTSSLPPSFDHINVTPAVSQTLVYPSDRPKYFMQFGIFDYKRDSLMEVGTLNPWKGGSNDICLPLSETLVDTLEAKWEEQAINWMVGGLSEAIKSFSEQEEKNRKYNADAKDAREIRNDPSVVKERWSQISAISQRLVVDNTGPLGTRVGAMYGVAPVRFVTVLYINPEYKHFSFQWNFSPRNKQESETLRRIVNVFKKAMSPTVMHQVLWGYPCIFRIMFRPNNEQLYKFRPSILKRINVNWTPLGRAAFYNTKDGYDEGNPPEGCTLQLVFQEIEYWTQERMAESPIRSYDINFAADN
jgi:hypothetical protein